MRADVRFRVAVAGAELRILVLTSEPGGCIGIDVDSGAFVRADFPTGTSAASGHLVPLDLVSGAIGEPLDPPDEARPEAVTLLGPPRRLGRMSRRRASRYLQPLLHAPQAPLLGFAGACTPYWTLGGDRPSLALLVPERGPELRRRSESHEPPDWECRFTWAGFEHQFPVRSYDLTYRLADSGRRRTGGRDLARIVGYTPERILVVLGPPVDGYCCKEVAALLPGGRG